MHDKHKKPHMRKAKAVVVAAVPAKKKRNRRKKRSGGFESLGRYIGTRLGGQSGGVIGSQAGRMVARVTGFGDYRVNRNSVVQGNSVPTFMNGGDGVRICHREFISDIVGSIAFTNRTYQINPGLFASFPLLSCLADCYEEYEMSGLVYEYRPSSGTALTSASAALGVVVLATNYDALDPPFASKQQMESYEYSTSTVPFKECLHPVECARNRNVLDSLYVRTGGVPAGGDIRMFDQGLFQIATQGMQSAYTVGELWVTYDVKFRKPRINGGNTGYVHIYSAPNSTADNTNLLGSAGIISPNSDPSLGVSIQSTYQVMISNPGTYMLMFTVSDSSTSAINVSFGTNIAAGPAAFNFNTGPSQICATAGTNNSYLSTIRVLAAGVSTANVFALQSGAFSSGNTDVYIFRLENLQSGFLAPPSRPLGFAQQFPPPSLPPLLSSPVRQPPSSSREEKDGWVVSL